MNTLALVAAATVVTAGAGYVIWDQFGTPHCTGDALPGQVASSDAFLLHLIVKTSGGTESSRICLYAADGTKVFDQDFHVPVGTQSESDLYLAQVPDVVIAEPSDGQAVNIDHASSWLLDCGSGKAQFLVEKLAKEGYLLSTMEDCYAGRSVQAAGFQNGPVVPAPENLQVPPGLAVAGLAVLGAGAYVFVANRRWLHWAFVGLFSRVTGPKVLDHTVRTNLHQLITQEPGIKASELLERLELAPGQLAYHLRVLLRERIVTATGGPFSRRYFVVGRYAPADMRRLALLRQPSLAAFYQAVKTRPGSPVSEVGREAGLSKPQASRMARRLADVGMVRLERVGRLLRIHPV